MSVDNPDSLLLAVGDQASKTQADISFARQLIMFVLLGTFISLGLILAYHFWNTNGTERSGFAVVDLNEVVEIKQLQFELVLLRPNVSDRDRSEAYEMVRQLGEQLPPVMDALHKQCQCVILTKSAVVAGEASDFTGQVKAALGIGGVSVKALKEQINAIR